jgi:hypothetical protein
MRERFNQPSWRSTVPSYQRASELIEPHLSRVPDAIRRLRASQPTISAITSAELCREFPDLSSHDAQFLVERFQRNGVQGHDPDGRARGSLKSCVR